MEIHLDDEEDGGSMLEDCMGEIWRVQWVRRSG